ncbi:MAG: trehalose-phosphatase [Gemmatimonadaceae bacterium]|nr:trehalose-phosphatase [Gemmatimonadaceae bacterium]
MMAATQPQEPSSDLPRPWSDLAYFFDLDGTLVELTAIPTGVEADATLQRLITEIAALADGAVAIITGRPISDIDRLFPGVGLPVAGQHGSERRNAVGEVIRHASSAHGLESARRTLHGVVAKHPTLLLEDKGLSIALHYRQAPQLAGFAHRTMHAIQRTVGDAFCVQSGKRVVELKPAGRDKGVAIMEFMAEPPFRGRVPVFIGDDVTDEHGFTVVNALHGMSIKVGHGRTGAIRQLPDVRAVRRWLTDHLAAHGATPITLQDTTA